VAEIMPLEIDPSGHDIVRFVCFTFFSVTIWHLKCLRQRTVIFSGEVTETPARCLFLPYVE
jgi:hypothetical protein